MDLNAKKSMEPVRTWYDRTTRKTRTVLIWFTVTATIFTVTTYMFVSHEVNLRLQVFNGAYTLPLAALIWILAFVYIFLVPSREVGFRSQESIERTVEILDDAVEKKVGPAVEVWKRLGERIEKELEAGLVDDVKSALKELRTAAGKMEESAKDSNGEIKKFTNDAQPTFEALRRLQTRFEQEIGTGFLDDLRIAAQAMKHMSVPPAKATEPDLDKALSVISRKKTAAALAPKKEGPPIPAEPEGLPKPVPVVAAPFMITKLEAPNV